jgi:hypothetical protein
MTTLERIAAEIVAAIFVIIAATVWWKVHNLDERKEGAVECIASTTQTKAAVAAENTADTSGQAKDLVAIVETQNAQVQNLQRDNADLVERVRRAESIRPSPVPDPRRAASQNCDASPVRAGQGDVGQPGDAGARISAQETLVLGDCDAEHARADAAVAAYNGWRTRMIERSQKTPTP